MPKKMRPVKGPEIEVKGCTCAELSRRYVIQHPSYGHFSECAALLASATPPVKVPHVHEPGGPVCHGSGLGCGVLPRPASTFSRVEGLGGSPGRTTISTTLAKRLSGHAPKWTCPDCNHSWWNHGPTAGGGRAPAGCVLCGCKASRPPEPDFAELERRVLAADGAAELGSAGHASLAEKYGPPPVERRAWRRGVLRDGEAEAVEQARAEGWTTDEVTEQHIFFVRAAAPTSMKLQPARQFAVLLARQLCVGNPLESFVDELTAAIERRDADVIHTVYKRAEEAVPPTRIARLAHVERELFKAVKLSDSDKEIVRRALAQAAES